MKNRKIKVTHDETTPKGKYRKYMVACPKLGKGVPLPEALVLMSLPLPGGRECYPRDIPFRGRWFDGTRGQACRTVVTSSLHHEAGWCESLMGLGPPVGMLETSG